MRFGPSATVLTTGCASCLVESARSPSCLHRETTVNGPGNKRQQREAAATCQVTFDGELIVNGEANHPTRPAPIIRVDTEK
jgi:hypothetical protein